MKECTGLEVLPVNVNLSSLQVLDLRGCSSLISFPQISKRIYYLYLDDTAIEEIPCSIKMLPRLIELSMHGCKMMKRFPQISSRIKILNLGDTAIEQVPCCIENLVGLTKLSMHGCKMLKNISPNIFSLTSLNQVDFTDCERLITVVATMEDHYENVEKGNNVKKRSTRSENMYDYLYGRGHFYFQNCFNLDEDARELILRSCFKASMVLPGGEVPTYFEHRAYGESLTVTLPQSSLSQEFLRFNACVVIEPLTDSYACMSVHFHFNGEHYTHTIAEGMLLMSKTDHLVLCSFKFRPTGLPSKLDYNDVEFKFSYTERIKECGIRLLNASSYPDDSDRSSETEYNQQSSEICNVNTEISKKRKRMTLERSEEYFNLPCGRIVTDTGLTAPNLELQLGWGESLSVSSYPSLEEETFFVDSMITEQQDAQIPIIYPDEESAWSSSDKRIVDIQE